MQLVIPTMDLIKLQIRNTSQKSPKSNNKTLIIVLLASLLPLFLFLLLRLPSSPSPKFGIVIDAGSTGTRIHIFRSVPRPGSASLGMEVDPVAEMKVRPGLSAYLSDPVGAAESVRQLVEFAREKVPRGEWTETEVRLMATAGLRMVEDDSIRDGILEGCRKVLRGSGFRFQDSWAAVISGADEGIFAWVAANYALGTLGGDPLETTGIIELGGASAQVSAFEGGGSNNLPNETIGDGVEGAILASDSTGDSPKKKISSKRSRVWDHFKEFKDNQGRIKSRCNYCGTTYFSHGKKQGTSSLKYHMVRCKKNPHNSDSKQALLNLQPTSMSRVGEENYGNLSAWKFDQGAIRKALSIYLIMDELPFKQVEGLGFKNFMAAACPRFVIPSRWTIARDCVNIYLEERSKLRKILKSNTQRVCLTTDTWTSLQRINYMVLTAHFIDNDWKLHKRILNFCPISSHKGEDIGKMVEKCLLEWGLDRVFTVTVDNASSNDVAIGYLKKKLINWGTSILGGKWLHVRCIAHIVNLVVVEGLKNASVSVARVRGAVRFVRSSPARLKKFKEYVEMEKLESKRGLCLDVSTRWNSTYMMLEAAEKFERAFERFDSESNQAIALDLISSGSCMPEENDWAQVRQLVTFLKVFYDVTLHISGSLYVTSNAYLDEVTDIHALLNDSLNSSDISLARMASKMKEKFDKYWGDVEKMNLLIYIAVIVDPRLKFEYVEYCIFRMHGNDTGNRMSRKVKEALYDMFDDYRKMNEKSVPASSSSSSSTNSFSRSCIDGQSIDRRAVFKEEFKRHKSSTQGADNKSELDKYLSEDAESEENFGELLNWWKVNTPRFPILSQLARDVLAVPISTVASESSFSTGGRVIDAFRSSLSPRVAQALICVQDWLKADMRPSTIEEKIEDIDNFDDEMGKIMSSTIIDI